MADESRIDKLEKLKEIGINPYPYSYAQTSHANDIIQDYPNFEGKNVEIAGRALRLRRMGKLYFIDLVDMTGKVQVMALPGATEENSLKIIEVMDAGDIIGVNGKVTKTKRGEISIEAKSIAMLAKSLRTLPEKFHGKLRIQYGYGWRLCERIKRNDKG